ncbi:MAG: mechanosensitive ion channel [Candidatus Omnitrophica bacterium]|nr:mechanosensitive ion channel [Candidatus Omnitrophota bacterium]
MEEAITKITELGVPFLLNLIAAIVIYIVGKWLAKVISNAIEKLMLKGKVDQALAGFTKNIINAAILIFTIIAAVGRIGVQTTSLIAVIGAAGLAVGLSLQGTLSNFAAGVMLILFRPFKVGDFIEGGGVLGTVKEIQIFNTILSSPDNRKIILPNSKVSGDTITNFSAIDSRRIDMVFGISYADDMKKAREVLMNVVTLDSRVLKDPAPVVAVSELGDSSVNLVCRPWVKPADYWAVYFDVTEKGKEALEANGLSIPFPQRDIHVYQEAPVENSSRI